MYYSGELMDEWEAWFREYAEEYPAPSYRLLQIALLRSDAIRWEEVRSSDPAFRIDILGGSLADNIVAEAANERCQSQKQVILLVNAAAFSKSERVLPFSFDGGKTYSHILDVRDLDVKEIAVYLSEKRFPERVFELNPKHGECRSEVRYESGRKVSPLKCTKEYAQKLLHMAFGQKEGLVWAYDDEANQLLEFKWQSDFVWHGYHIDEKDEKLRNIPAWLLKLIHHVRAQSS